MRAGRRLPACRAGPRAWGGVPGFGLLTERLILCLCACLRPAPCLARPALLPPPPPPRSRPSCGAPQPHRPACAAPQPHLGPPATPPHPSSHPSTRCPGPPCRFLGSLLPTRPYATVVKRFPALLAGRLERTLRGLQRHAPDRLARVDLTLLVSQQPTLLLGGSRGVLAAWSQLEAVCERVPAWAAQLETLTQPVEGAAQAAQAQRQRGVAEAEAAQQATQQGQQAERAPEPDSWLEDVYRSAGADSGRGSVGSGSQLQPSAPGLLPPIHEAPSWFHQEPEAAAVAERPGAFGSLRRQARRGAHGRWDGSAVGGHRGCLRAANPAGSAKYPALHLLRTTADAAHLQLSMPTTHPDPLLSTQWREPDRLRVRQLARILDSRPWQRLVSRPPRTRPQLRSPAHAPVHAAALLVLAPGPQACQPLVQCSRMIPEG